MHIVKHLHSSLRYYSTMPSHLPGRITGLARPARLVTEPSNLLEFSAVVAPDAAVAPNVLTARTCCPTLTVVNDSS